MNTEPKSEIREGNRLIAEFMERKFFAYRENSSFKKEFSSYDDCQFFIEENNLTGYAPELGWRLGMGEYHTSWDWLMPVVDKIIEIDIKPAPDWRGYRIEIVPRGYVEITGFPMPRICKNVSIEGSLINAVYQAVIEFIKWYNQSQP